MLLNARHASSTDPRSPGYAGGTRRLTGGALGTSLLALLLALLLAGSVLLLDSFEVQAFLVAATAVGVAAVALTLANPTGGAFSRALGLALAARLAGSLAAYILIVVIYSGQGDPPYYFAQGLRLVEQARAFGIGEALGQAGQLWGTAFVIRLSALLTLLAGPSLLLHFLLFALAALAGLVALSRAYAGAFHLPAAPLLLWFSFWPSVFLWPSHASKDALMVAALGLIAYGYVQALSAQGILALGNGLILAALVRPHAALIVAAALALGSWVSRSGSRSASTRIVEVLLWAAALGAVWVAATGALGISGPEELVEFVQERSGSSSYGGTAIEPPPFTPVGMVQALLTGLFRPYPWEATHAIVLLPSLEIMALLALALLWRRGLVLTLRHWREHRLLAFSLAFIVLYAVYLGFGSGNLGTITRVRSLSMPFILLLLELARVRSAGRARPAGGADGGREA